MTVTNNKLQKQKMQKLLIFHAELEKSDFVKRSEKVIYKIIY